MNQDVFFETIRPSHRPLVWWYLQRGRRVFVFDFTYRLKRMPWLRRLINQERVQRVSIYPGLGADALAMEATEWLFPRYVTHPLIQALAKEFGHSEVEPLLKKALLDRVFRYCFIRLFLERHLRIAGDGQRVLLVPSTFCAWDRQLLRWHDHPLGGVRIAGPVVRAWSALWNAIEERRLTLVLCVRSALRLAWAGFVQWVSRRPEPTSDVCTHLYAIDQPFQTKFQGVRTFNFLLDGQGITRENTGFLIHWSAEGSWMDKARAAGYRIIARRETTDPWRDWHSPPRRLKIQHWLRLVARTVWHIGGPAWLTETAALGALVGIHDEILFARIRFTNYIYTNQDDVVQRWHNVMIRRAGGLSWCFTLSIGGAYLHWNAEALRNGHWRRDRHRYWAYQNPDFFVGQSRQLIEHHRQHHQRIQAYHSIGNLWSELVFRAEAQFGCGRLREQWFGERAQGRKIIAWFDTSFVEDEHATSTYTEAIAWYRDIERLLEEQDDLLAIIKPSKDEPYFIDETSQWSHPLGHDLMAIWRRLRRHPRVYFAGDAGDPQCIIAASDLTVTFCFSSVSAEALGARKRAIWYEPGERWRQTLYGAEPWLVAHGYDELRSLVRTLLYTVSDDEYAAYLDGKVRGLVEDHLDGQGLSRFRSLLVKEAAQGSMGSSR